jgi:hypothetical protein
MINYHKYQKFARLATSSNLELSSTSWQVQKLSTGVGTFGVKLASL